MSYQRLAGISGIVFVVLGVTLSVLPMIDGAIRGVNQREISAAWRPINVWFEHSV